MAAINFPDPNVSNPETGNPYKDGWYNSSNGVTYVYTNGVWRAASSEQSFEDIFVNKSGDDMTGNLTVPSLNGGPLAGFRNLIINGDFRIWQRGVGPKTIINSSADFLADRWKPRASGLVGGTTTQELFEDGAINKYRFTATGVTSVAYLAQDVEAASCRHLAGQEVTASCYASHQPSFNIATYDSTDTGSSESISGIPVPGESNRWYATFTLPNQQLASSPEKTGFRIQISYNNAENPLSNGTYDMWNIQLEPGPVATPFEHRPYGTELALCQRYYERFMSPNNDTPVYMGKVMAPSVGYSGTGDTDGLMFKVPKRVTPTVVVYGLDAGSGFPPNELHVQNTNSGVNKPVSDYIVTPCSFIAKVTVDAAGTFYNCLAWGYTADAEL